MTSDITDKTMVLISKLGDFWINQGQAKTIVKLMEQKPESTVELQGNFLPCRYINGILTAESYNALNARRRGAWQCDTRHWHERFERCEHNNAIRKALQDYTDHAAA